MKRSAWNILYLAIVVIAVAGCKQMDVYTHGVPNLAQVEPGIWRGGQPTSDGWKYLHSLGVTNVVKLNEEEPSSSDSMAKDLGMSVFNAPIPLRQQLFGVPERTIWQAVNHIGQDTYIHCLHGEDRTGLVVGAYRVWVEGWDKQMAYQEMIDHGFHPELMGLFTFYREKL